MAGDTKWMAWVGWGALGAGSAALWAPRGPVWMAAGAALSALAFAARSALLAREARATAGLANAARRADEAMAAKAAPGEAKAPGWGVDSALAEAKELALGLDRSRERFEALGVAAAQGVFMCSAAGEVSGTNLRFEQLTRGAKSIEGIAGEEGRADLRSRFEQASADGARLRWEGWSTPEEGVGGVAVDPRRLAVALVPLERGPELSFLGAVLDVSEKRRMEMRLTFERDKAERVMEAINEAMLYLDAYGHIERASAGMLAMLGREGADIKGLWVGRAVRMCDRFDGAEAPLEEMLTHEGLDSDRWLLERGDGVLVPIDLRWRKLRDESFEGVLSMRDISERVAEIDRIRWEANHDPLTGLLNRRAFSMALEGTQIRLAREGRPAALLMLDLDGFKGVNDRFGHETGDAILKMAAEAIQAAAAPFDFVARLGGDEFALLMEGSTKREGEEKARELREAISGGAIKAGSSIARVDVSIGVAEMLPGDPKGSMAMRRADQEMYDQKRASAPPGQS